MPKVHRDHAEWTPTRMLRWAETVGPKTAELVTAIIDEKPHPEHGYRACLGILRLGRRYGEPRLEAASARAVIVRSRTVLSVGSILKRGLDRQPLPVAQGTAEPPRPILHHECPRSGLLPNNGGRTIVECQLHSSGTVNYIAPSAFGVVVGV
jgi:transposase